VGGRTVKRGSKDDSEREVVYFVPKPKGYGILDAISDSLPWRLARLLAPLAVIVAIIGYLQDLGEKRAAHSAEAWQILSSRSPGNSGKIEALEYLNSENVIQIPNPRRWGIPVGPTKASPTWILLADYGPWKTRIPLTGIDLSPPGGLNDFQGAVFLQRVRLPEADLTAAHLSLADMYLADFSGAHLRSAEMWKSNLLRANFRGADLSFTHLACAWLDHANFDKANLDGARLHLAEMDHSTARNADFEYADLSGVDFEGTDLSGSNFSSALLDGAQFEDSNLTNAKGITQEQLDQACANDRTLLPRGLKSPPRCAHDKKGGTPAQLHVARFGEDGETKHSRDEQAGTGICPFN
jgi:hypothetical protein